MGRRRGGAIAVDVYKRQVNTWVIPKTARNPELSWRVVEFLSGKEGQQIALAMNYGLPASTMVDTTEFEAKTPYNKLSLIHI